MAVAQQLEPRLGELLLQRGAVERATLVELLGRQQEDHIPLGQDVYWYRWDSDNAGCKIATQQLKITLSKLLPKPKTVYPEWDRLTAVEDHDGIVPIVPIAGEEAAESTGSTGFPAAWPGAGGRSRFA